MFDRVAWRTRKEWWSGTKQISGGSILPGIINVFPWVFALRHPVKAWKYRNMRLVIPGINDVMEDETIVK